jgi:large subunit ribosomal protein L6e
MPRKPHAPRNKPLARGVPRYSRSVMYSKTGTWAVKNKKPTQKKTEAKAPKVQPFGKGTRTIQQKLPRFYPTEDVPKPLPSRKSHHRPTRLRSSITPGTVLILLAGRFRGKRVVFLKQLASGLLLVTGPYKVNGVPLRRVNQAYVIATATVVDVSGSKLDPKFNDDYFKKAEKEKKKKTEADFFATESQKKKIEEHRVADQKAVDAPILTVISKTERLREYLKAKFSLKRGQYPHDLKF